jgi:hypothetical protein
MELELKKLYDTVTSIHDEMFYLRERYKHNLFSMNKNSVTYCTRFDSTYTLATCLHVFIFGEEIWKIVIFFLRRK